MGTIGGIKIDGIVLLGPMAGVTSLAYREFMKPFGVALSFSEMISDCAIVYGNKKTEGYFVTSSVDRPVGLQLFGCDPAMSVKAVGILESKADYDLLDLNFGCPVHKVTKTGAGSSFLKDTDRLYRYARAIVMASHKPVTAKIRLGYDLEHVNFRENAAALVSAGVSLITIHSRTTSELYAGTAHHDWLKDFGKELSVPLCISGDVFTPEAAIEAMKLTGASYVMVARGGLGNPRLVTNINRLYEGKEVLPAPSLQEEVGFARDFMHRLVLEKGESVAVKELRGLLPHFFRGFRGYKKIRNDIATLCFTLDDLEKVVKRVETTDRL